MNRFQETVHNLTAKKPENTGLAGQESPYPRCKRPTVRRRAPARLRPKRRSRWGSGDPGWQAPSFPHSGRLDFEQVLNRFLG